MTSSRLLRSVLHGAALAASVLAGGAHAQATPGNAAPFGASRPVPDRYIVVFRDTVANPAALASQMAQAQGGRLHHAYSRALKGFAATLPPAAVQALRNHPLVAYVEQDQTVALNQAAATQSPATWGLDRVDQRERSLNNAYGYNHTGAGVTAFVIDTGLRATHLEFTGRVGAGFTSVNDGNGTNDCNGHGTHVAGTIGGTTWGIAKQATLVPVRVLNCSGSGTWSGVIAGIDFVAASTARPAVANMSLGGGASNSVDTAVRNAVAAGVAIAVAAGNSNVDACTTSPAREPSALTVGATTSADARASYSNFGSCLDLFAPGSSITSSWHTGDTAANTISGTSMASPHVAGAAALLLQAFPAYTPAQVGDAIRYAATANPVTSAGTGSPNLLLYTLGNGSTTATNTAVALRSIGSTAVRSGANWKASVTVTVYDVGTGALVPNATVTGSFAPGGNASCVTAGNGACSMTSSTLKASSAPSTTFTASGITGTRLAYTPSQNLATSIIVKAP